MSKNRQQQRKRLRLAMGIAATALVVCSGCNPFAFYQRRHTGYDFYGERQTAYYHYPGGAWFVPAHQRHHEPVVTEPPFFGYQATCWRPWPEPWMPCPPPGCGPVEGEIIEVPLHEGAPVPVPLPADVVPPPGPPDVPGSPSDLPKSSAKPVLRRPANHAQARAPEPKFFGAHGFSSSDDGTPENAAVVDLSVSKAAHEDSPSLQESVSAELEGLKKLVR